MGREGVFTRELKSSKEWLENPVQIGVLEGGGSFVGKEAKNIRGGEGGKTCPIEEESGGESPFELPGKTDQIEDEKGAWNVLFG